MKAIGVRKENIEDKDDSLKQPEDKEEVDCDQILGT